MSAPRWRLTNDSKPYQIQLIRAAGFPDSGTPDHERPRTVRDFRARNGRIIYKSISSVRSIVQEFTDPDEDRLETLRWRPAQFQAFVEGTNVRVHTVGDEVFATAACTEATDYRYASGQSGAPAELREAELSDELAEKCVQLSKALDLRSPASI